MRLLSSIFKSVFIGLFLFLTGISSAQSQEIILGIYMDEMATENFVYSYETTISTYWILTGPGLSGYDEIWGVKASFCNSKGDDPFAIALRSLDIDGDYELNWQDVHHEHGDLIINYRDSIWGPLPTGGAGPVVLATWEWNHIVYPSMDFPASMYILPYGETLFSPTPPSGQVVVDFGDGFVPVCIWPGQEYCYRYSLSHPIAGINVQPPVAQESQEWGSVKALYR